MEIQLNGRIPGGLRRIRQSRENVDKTGCYAQVRLLLFLLQQAGNLFFDMWKMLLVFYCVHVSLVQKTKLPSLFNLRHSKLGVFAGIDN